MSKVTNTAPASVLRRRYEPALCCWHRWQDAGNRTQQRCELCGAECKRNPEGFMVDYDATAGATRVRREELYR